MVCYHGRLSFKGELMHKLFSTLFDVVILATTVTMIVSWVLSSGVSVTLSENARMTVFGANVAVFLAASFSRTFRSLLPRIW